MRVETGRRVLNCFVWMRTFPLDNYYAHPVEGLHALDRPRDAGDPAASRIISPRQGRLHPGTAHAAQLRCRPADRVPRAVGAPGRRAARWRRIHRRRQQGHMGELGLPGRLQRSRGPGPVHDRLHAGGRRRPIVYRASIAEMVVPYGTPERSHYRKNVFDTASSASAAWPTR